MLERLVLSGLVLAVLAVTLWLLGSIVHDLVDAVLAPLSALS